MSGVWLIASMVACSVVAGAASRTVIGFILRGAERIRNAEYGKQTKRELKLGGGALVASFTAWPFYYAMSIPARPQEWMRWAIECLTILGAVLSTMGLWDAACDSIVLRAGDRIGRADRLLVPVTRKLIRFVVFLIGVALAMEVMGVNVAALVTGLGIGGVAIALAAKDSVENIFGSLTVLFDMPFAIGDWVRIDKVEGVVEQINLRSTKIRTFEDTLITLPNANLIRASVENFGARRYRRQKFVVRVAADENADSIESFCAQVQEFIDARFGVWPEKTIVKLTEAGDPTFGVLVQFFVEAEDQAAEMAQRHEVMIEILRVRERHGVRAPQSFVATPRT